MIRAQITNILKKLEPEIDLEEGVLDVLCKIYCYVLKLVINAKPKKFIIKSKSFAFFCGNLYLYLNKH